MAKTNAFNEARVTGRLADHPIFKDNKDGSQSAFIRVIVDRDELDPETNRPKTDTLPFTQYISEKRRGKSPMAWAYKGSQVTLTAALREFRREVDGQMRSDLRLEIDDFKVLESAAQSETRLKRYAENGDEKAAEILAERAQRAQTKNALPSEAPVAAVQS